MIGWLEMNCQLGGKKHPVENIKLRVHCVFGVFPFIFDF